MRAQRKNHALSSFNGAARFCVRKFYLCMDNDGEIDGLQWGRTFLRAEIRFFHELQSTATPASMGPHVFACGNTSNSSRRHTDHPASMGPHVFACGNAAHGASGLRAAWLQWGRTFLRAEIELYAHKNAPYTQLQWGRTFLRAEI